MRVVVTGATGNVGTGVVRALVAAGHEVVGVARRLPAPGYLEATWHRADVARDRLPLAGADAVVHLAWQIHPSRDIGAMWANNIGALTHVLDAAVAAGIRTIAVASSLAAYSPAPVGHPPVDESWPTGGEPTSSYARQKAHLERVVEAFVCEHPDVRVAVMRMGLVAQRAAGSQFRRFMLGSLVPNRLIAPPAVPDTPGLALQAVHSDDVGEAFRRAVESGARGAFNLVADPPLTPATLADALGVPRVPVPARLLVAGHRLAWRLRLVPIDPGWTTFGLAVPLLDAGRAARELDWRPGTSGTDAALELLGGMRDGAGAPTPPLRSDREVRRLRELLATRQGAVYSAEIASIS